MPARLQMQHSILAPRCGRARRVMGLKKCHWMTEFDRLVKSSDSAMPCGCALPPLGLAIGCDRSPPHLEPAIARPLDRIEQRLPPERPVAVFIAVIDTPPIAGGPFDEGGMPARPPFLGAAVGAHQRVVGVLLPRAVDRFRTRGDDHVPGGWPRRAAHRGDQIE